MWTTQRTEHSCLNLTHWWPKNCTNTDQLEHAAYGKQLAHTHTFYI